MKNAVKQNWQKATKKRILFKLGETLVGDIDLIQESNNNNNNNDPIIQTMVVDEQDRELRKLADHAASVKFDDEDDWNQFRNLTARQIPERKKWMSLNLLLQMLNCMDNIFKKSA